MTEKELAFLLKYSSPKELYVVTYDNRLVLLICPFPVVVKEDISFLKKADVVFVDEIKVTKDLVTVYIIKGKAFYYYHFYLPTD